MCSNKTKEITFNTLGSIFGWTSFGIGVSAVTSDFWIRNSTVRSGLWNACIRDTLNCSAISVVEPWLNAVRAFMILFMIFIFLGDMVSVISQWKYNKKTREGAGGICSIAATFGMVGAAVYTSFINQGNPSGSFEYGYGFGAAWGVVGAGYLGGLFYYLSARYMDEYYA